MFHKKGLDIGNQNEPEVSGSVPEVKKQTHL